MRKNPSDDETLIAIADRLGLDVAQFSTELNSDETQQQLMKEIQFGQNIGARGFPSMILEEDGAYHYVPLNYNDPESALNYIQQI